MSWLNGLFEAGVKDAGEDAGEDLGKTTISSVGKSKNGIVAGFERFFGANKETTAGDFDRAAKTGEDLTKTGAKTAEKTAEGAATEATKDGLGKKLLKGTGKLAGKGAVAGAGALLSGGKKVAGTGAKALLGSKGGVSSLLKLGGIGALLTLLLNPQVSKGIAEASASMVKQTGSAQNNGGKTSSAAPNYMNENLKATGTNPSFASATTGSALPSNLPSTGSVAQDNYRQNTVSNLNHVVQSQNQTQNQATHQQDVGLEKA